MFALLKAMSMRVWKFFYPPSHPTDRNVGVMLVWELVSKMFHPYLCLDSSTHVLKLGDSHTVSTRTFIHKPPFCILVDLAKTWKRIVMSLTSLYVYLKFTFELGLNLNDIEYIELFSLIGTRVSLETFDLTDLSHTLACRLTDCLHLPVCTCQFTRCSVQRL